MFKNKLQNLLAILGAVFGTAILLVLFILLMENTFPVNASAACENDAQMIDPIVFDTTAIDAWCREEDIGTVRMVGAWVAESVDNTHTLNDETGNVWTVEDITLYEDDWLLLWIADNHTTEDVTDDIIIKVWAEAH